MKLSEKILYLRKEKGWSQEHLASKLDVSRQAVYKWEAGLALPEIDKIKKLSDIFNITYDNLMNDEISLPLINKEASSKEQSNNDDAEIEITAPSEEGCSCKAEEKKEGVPCPRCGFIEADSSAFCSECGYSLLDEPKKAPEIKKTAGGFCTNCGAKLTADSLFCMECGTKLPKNKYCPQCGTEVADTARFCFSCGASISASSGVSVKDNVFGGNVSGSFNTTNNNINNITNTYSSI